MLEIFETRLKLSSAFKMEELNGTSERTRDNSNRPFYELPAHIKPCSKIIQETRMQLKHSKKFGSCDISFGSSSSGSVGDGDVVQQSCDFSVRRGSSGSGEFYNGHVVELPNIHSNEYNGAASRFGIKPVDTKRPFTPRDSVSLWGVSARKRPPSAITLSRLAIDENDESGIKPNVERSLQSPFFNNEGNNSSYNGKFRVPKSSLGKVPKLQPATGKSSYSFDSAAEVLGGLAAKRPSSPSVKAERDVEKSRLKLKSLSLQNDSTLTSYLDGDGRGSNHMCGNGTGIDHNLTGSERKLPHQQQQPSTVNSVSGQGTQIGNVDEEFFVVRNNLCGPTRLKKNAERTYDNIDSMDVAITCLQSLVSSPYDRATRGEIILVLKKVCGLITDAHKSPQLKTKLLRLIFKLVERNQTDEDILFWASFVLLHCDIVGNNLTTIFKMVFKASRSKEYWGIIKETEYLDALMSSFSNICPRTQTESMIYGYGTLKFICMDTPVLHRCIELNLVPIMTHHLKILNTEVLTMNDVPESIFNGTFQLTSILRSVVGEDGSTLDMVVRSGLLEELCNSLHWTIADIDVVSNIVRILSVISMDDTCCQVISRNEQFVESIVRVLKLWIGKDDVMVRVAYCLGNLFAKSDEMRVKLFDGEDTYRLILNLISHHVKKPTPVSMDILVKAVRIIANWILNPSIGWEICDDQLLSELLYSILLMNNVSDELVLCVISTMNNTSFYKDYNVADDFTLRTAEYLFCNLITKDIEVKTEAMKVLGNLTRNPDVRCAAMEYVDNVLHCLEDERDEELLCATCGVLINIIVDERVKSEFLKLGGIDSLLSVLRTRNDLAVVMMASQILWNLTMSNIENGHIMKYGIEEDKKSEIRKLLLIKLQGLEANSRHLINNEASIGDQNDMESELLHPDFYTDFESVARSLLEKL